MFGIPSLCQTVRVGKSALVTLKKEPKHGYFCDPDSNRRAFRMLGPYCLPDFYTSYLRTFARNFSNIDFFLKILPLKDDELAMSEM